MAWVAMVLALVLWGIALVHLYWALGGLWPARSGDELVRMVVGGEGARAMPGRGLTLAVALLIALAGLWPLLYLGRIAAPLPSWLIGPGMWGLAALFLLRGALTYLPRAWHRQKDLPFYRLNRRCFSPLSLVIGAGYSVLLLA